MALTAGFNHVRTITALLHNPNAQTFILIGFILTTGTMFVTWLGEQITEKGIGNGVSMIIFAGIISRLPVEYQRINRRLLY